MLVTNSLQRGTAPVESVHPKDYDLPPTPERRKSFTLMQNHVRSLGDPSRQSICVPPAVSNNFIVDATVKPSMDDLRKIEHLIQAAGAPHGIEGPIPSYAGIFDMFKRGIGPSSSHTNGPINIAAAFVQRSIVLQHLKSLSRTTIEDPDVSTRIKIKLYGSLGATGKGHGTDNAVLQGLQGRTCDEIDDIDMPTTRALADSDHVIRIGKDTHWISFHYDEDIEWLGDIEWSSHPNGMTIQLLHLNDCGEFSVIDTEDYLSLGGGFFVSTAEYADGKVGVPKPVPHTFYFQTWEQLESFSKKGDIAIAEIMYRNEMDDGSTRSQVDKKIDALIRTMFDCVNKGCSTEGPLPLRGLRRQAQAQFLKLKACKVNSSCVFDPLTCLDYVSVYARAANEENACGCTVVTAPTNGACGILPAVMAYYWNFIPGSSKQGLRDFMAVAAAIGSLIKRNASISGAEAGCQAEVGSAISITAAGLCAVLGGSVTQIGFAAEMGIEHSLGLTCDPIGGLVVVPCIDRNALGSTKAIMCARLALLGCEAQVVSLDSVIETMFVTGVDLQSKYKETSLGGLATIAASPSHKGLKTSSCGHESVALKPLYEKDETACAGCNCELDDELDVPMELEERQVTMHGQTRAIQEEMLTSIGRLDGEHQDIVDDGRKSCPSCEQKHEELVQIRHILTTDRSIPLAVDCNIGLNQ